MLFGLLMVVCFIFCFSYQNLKEFVLINLEKSSIKEMERKEIKVEEELDVEVLEVFYLMYEWQVFQLGQVVFVGFYVWLNFQIGEREVKF